ncbi:DUF1524 domain-containing protein [Arthrobacter sp. I2-34]|uniref:DUF1524 domain-containing protein n=1 Tax=Arthrobacter hankyongi TaxID=2904801 RepID=A0ABS9LDV8_9MICC|nr:DUF1524 domain-containing protein [Arthrobacter hankyongi]MCG2624886.1 DUF1524 domain-containing protein [Arthrobacter hankyongi]
MTAQHHPSRTRTLTSLAAAALAVVVLSACGSEAATGTVGSAPPAAVAAQTSGPAQTPRPQAPTAAASPVKVPKTTKPSPAPAATKAGTALAQLATIAIKGRAPKTGYSRDQFGHGWQDPDRNGCDARNDILARDLTDETFRPGTNNCIVISGTLAEPYTGTVINFVRGYATSTQVQIDHVVALADAWQKGAQRLAPNQRQAFANDPLNLMAADGPANQAKSASDAASWLPPNKAFRCEYVALQTAVKAKYKLWMTQSEHDAIARVLASCPDQPVPDDDGGVSVPVAVKQAPKPKAAPEKAPAAPRPATEGGVFYQNCTAVRAAGAAPIRAGDPGWETKFDRDGDGVGCEG